MRRQPVQPTRTTSVAGDGISTSTAIDQLSGRGVGLAAVYAAVKCIGGDMQVFSTRGHGTTFQFRCPFIESLPTEGE
ncbi:MAG: ATP-binding protein [Solidesulfovibrio sp. DCME]|uniref:ATP-binding protein n=1 Tax=Solidesulfovibrio sp. DCME TaxID=3447380 RepID=UPI003D0D04BE